ncbi:MAG: hypothetical protein P9L92_12220 [Candidatus Electryonea clarkiae]|nr:hypothetical protein [Candidatus Electryonea clarkiae]MDP8286921.1 hypothetical protein [Candidatus Electryonea clarkiae]
MDDTSGVPPVTRRDNPYKNPHQGEEYKRKKKEEEEENGEERKGPPTDDSALIDVRV